MRKPLIGFIGQGFIGKNLASNFEKRGYKTVRYAQEKGYNSNKDAIKGCDIVFIAVPTPTTPKGFDMSVIENVLTLVGKGNTAVIKSTILPGSTKKLQKKHKGIFVLHSPEFLTESNVIHDTDFPARNIVGIPVDSEAYKNKAKMVLSVLPKAPYDLVCSSQEAELIKYGGNNLLYLKVVYMNMLYDFARKIGADWEKVSEAMLHDSRLGGSHMKPVQDKGRGAGGHCFPKDLEAFIQGYAEVNKQDTLGKKFLEAARNKNLELLQSTGKDIDILLSIYGTKIKKKK
jgi:nucleotide sugar dehydrogenase